MARFSVPLDVMIEAESAEAAFAYVRTHFTVTDNYALAHGGRRDDEHFYVLPPVELEEAETVFQ
jgi:hypothetical protein